MTLKTQLVVREDSQTLYGFATDDERELFKMIQGVSGIGPRLALNVLSGMNVASFKGAISDGDVKRLSSISGIGKKTAERMVLELKDKVGTMALVPGAVGSGDAGPVPVAAGGPVNDATSALVNLGYRPSEALAAVSRAAGRLGDDTDVEALIRGALSELAPIDAHMGSA